METETPLGDHPTDKSIDKPEQDSFFYDKTDQTTVSVFIYPAVEY